MQHSLKPQMEFFRTCSGILHLECKVYPLFNRVAAIPEIAVAKISLLCDSK